MRGFQWGGEEYYPPGVLRDPLQSGNDSVGWRHPDQEHRVNPIQAAVQGLWTSEVSAHDFNVCRQTNLIRVAHQRTCSHPCTRQLREDLAPDVARRSDDEDAFHKGQSIA